MKRATLSPPLSFSPRPIMVPQDISAIQAMIDEAQHPLIVAGAMLRGSKRITALQRFAEALRIPVAVTWKNQDIFDNGSPLFAGHLGFGNPPKHRQVLANADLIIAVGTRLGDVASLNYSFPAAPQPKQKLIHIYPDGEAIGKVFRNQFWPDRRSRGGAHRPCGTSSRRFLGARILAFVGQRIRARIPTLYFAGAQ